VNVAARQRAVNFGLLFVAALLVLVALVTRGSVTSGELAARPNNVLAAWRQDDVSRLVIERGGKQIELERDAGDGAGESDWQLRKPIRERAEPHAVHQVLGALELMTWLRRFDAGEVKRQAFGFDAPELVVRLDMGSISYRLVVGKAAGDARYVEIGGDGIPERGAGLVAKDRIEELGVALDDLRSRSLVPYATTELSGIGVERSDDAYALRRTSYGAWQFRERHAGLRVSRRHAERMLSVLLAARAERFVEVRHAESSLAAAGAIRLTLTPDDASAPPAKLELGPECPEGEGLSLALRRAPDPVACCVPRTLFDAFSVPSTELVDTTAFFAEAAEVERLTAIDGADRMELVRVEQRFELRAPVAGKVELDAGNRRLEAMVSAQGELVAPPPGAFPEQRRVTIQAVSPLGVEAFEETLAIGPRQPNGDVLMRRKADGAVLALDPDVARLFRPDSTLLRSLNVLDVDRPDVAAVEVRAGDFHQRVERGENGTYRLTIPEGFEPDASASGALLDSVRALRAVRWIADRDDGSFGLEQPRIVVTLSLRDGDAGTRRHELRIGKTRGGATFATRGGDGAVFALDSATLETLQTWVVDRSLFMLETSAVKRLVLERGGERVVLERRAGRLAQSAGRPELSDGQIDAVASALDGLRAEAAIHLGPPAPTEGFADPTLRVDATLELPNGGERRVTYRVGAGDAWRNLSVYYVRRDDRPATYVIARALLAPVLGVLGGG
jgi:hypothetical protein